MSEAPYGLIAMFGLAPFGQADGGRSADINMDELARARAVELPGDGEARAACGTTHGQGAENNFVRARQSENQLLHFQPVDIGQRVRVAKVGDRTLVWDEGETFLVQGMWLNPQPAVPNCDSPGVQRQDVARTVIGMVSRPVRHRTDVVEAERVRHCLMVSGSRAVPREGAHGISV